MVDFLPAGYRDPLFDQRSLNSRAIGHDAAVVEERQGDQEPPEDQALHEDEGKDADRLILLAREKIEGPVPEGLLDDPAPPAQVVDAGLRMIPHIVVPRGGIPG